MNLLLFIIIGYGITNILVFGSIFFNIRLIIINNSKFFGDLIQCMMCTSFWVGMFLSAFIFSPTTHYGFIDNPLSLFLDACLASGAVWILHNLEEALERHKS